MAGFSFRNKFDCLSAQCYFRFVAVVWTLAVAISLTIEYRNFTELLAGHGILWLAGLCCIAFGARRLRRIEKELSRAEMAFRRSQELSSIVLESTNDAIAIINVADYTIVSANSVFLKDYGCTEEEVLGKTCYAVTHNRSEVCVPPDDRCPLLQTVATGGSALEEHCHFGSDGAKHYEEVATYPIRDAEGDLTQVLHVARDITARKLSEERLRDSEARYRTIFENTGTATTIIEEDFGISMVNKEFEKLSGYRKEEIEGVKRWSDLIVIDDLPRILEYQRQHRLAPDVDPQVCEFRMLDKEGRVRVLAGSCSIIPGTDRLVGSYLDVTEQRVTEEALQKSRAILALAQRIAQLGSWEWDVEANVLNWSNEMFRIYGVKPAEFPVTYESFIHAVHPGDREAVNRGINEALYACKGFGMDFRIILPNGAERTVYGQGEVTFAEDGKPLRMVGTTQDITWRKEAAEALRHSEEKFSKAFQASPDWIVITRAVDGCYIDVNDAFLAITGFRREEVIGRNSVELGIWLAPQARISMLKILNDNGMVRNLETHFRMENGETRAMLWSADVIEYGGEACLIAIARDVSPQRALENELLESRTQLSIKHEELKNVFLQMETIRRDWEQTLDCISDMFILADQDDRIRRFNRALEMFTGKAHRDIVGRVWQEFLAEHGLAANVAEPGEELRHGQTGRWFVLNHYAFTDTEGNGLARNVVIIHDATTENQVPSCPPE